MKELKTEKITEKSINDMLDEQYMEADNKGELDYWAPLSKVIMESIELRDSKGMSQTDLASVMKTTQSVISRFENMGRLPNYDFIARLAAALGHSPGMTLYGDYMAVVPFEKQIFIKKMANEENISTRKFVQKLLDQGIIVKTEFYETQRKIANLISASETSLDKDQLGSTNRTIIPLTPSKLALAS